ncbi:MAG TPA: hypothetical protein VFA04_02265 [Bryobacteraceae bacterium]|nr:hypothetical protein [Bryobacteraceae bacterium]
MKWLVLTLCASSVVSAADIVPMEKGTAWTYRGEVAWAGDGDQVKRAKVQWKMEVVDSQRQGRYRVARLMGYPSDLTFYQPDRQRGCHLLIAVDVKLYLTGCPAGDTALTGIDFSKLTNDDLILELPLEKGNTFAADSQRDDTMYAWHVEDVGPAKVAGIAGVRPDFHGRQYDLIYRTLPDHQIAIWVPGLGLTSYIYSHHGTASQVDIRLIEFQHP